ncbi:MAG: hypothetical protein V8S26_01700 [Lachnospiraceae bacterium]
MIDNNGNMFPHDGEHGRECTGYGCNCDEKNYGRSGSSNSGGGCGILSGIVMIGVFIGFFYLLSISVWLVVGVTVLLFVIAIVFGS